MWVLFTQIAVAYKAFINQIIDKIIHKVQIRLVIIIIGMSHLAIFNFKEPKAVIQ